MNPRERLDDLVQLIGGWGELEARPEIPTRGTSLARQGRQQLKPRLPHLTSYKWGSRNFIQQQFNVELKYPGPLTQYGWQNQNMDARI
jgi:hypothetical protein